MFVVVPPYSIDIGKDVHSSGTMGHVIKATPRRSVEQGSERSKKRGLT
jgi:hypothetical protein